MNNGLLNGATGVAIPLPLPEFGKRVSLPTVAELDALRDQSAREGFAQGLAEGRSLAEKENQHLVAQVQRVLKAFTHPLQQSEQDLRMALTELAVAVAGALVGHLYEIQPMLMAALVDRAIEDLGRERRAVDVRMHPDDLAVLQSILDLPSEVRALADVNLERGDCRVHAEPFRIDASLATRMKSLLAELNCEGASA